LLKLLNCIGGNIQLRYHISKDYKMAGRVIPQEERNVNRPVLRDRMIFYTIRVVNLTKDCLEKVA